jgi:hypothetical protein
MYSLIDVPQSMTYNAAFLCHIVIPSLLADVTTHWRGTILNGLVIHVHDVRPHNSRQSQEYIAAFKVQRLQHPANSQDLVPSEFFPFEYLKQKLMDFNCETRP